MRLGFLFPQIISGVCAFVGDGSVGSVFPFLFAFGWELFFRVIFFIGVDSGLGNRQTFFIDGGAGFLYPLSSLDRQRRRSFNVREGVDWSCGSDVTCGSWSGSAASHLVVFHGRRNVRRRSMPELWKTEAEALLCVLFVLSFNLRGVFVNWVCTVYLYAI